MCGLRSRILTADYADNKKLEAQSRKLKIFSLVTLFQPQPSDSLFPLLPHYFPHYFLLTFALSLLPNVLNNNTKIQSHISIIYEPTHDKMEVAEIPNITSAIYYLLYQDYIAYLKYNIVSMNIL